ncbi:MAG: hypothetical protein OXG44_20530, partial [Gammaproteobacteria bacterium]|nr:hypothetical protein [Gammaproteobacteria bacterium]
MVERTRTAAALLVFCLTTGSVSPASDENAEALPARDTSPLFWTQQERIVGFRNFDAIYDT